MRKFIFIFLTTMGSIVLACMTGGHKIKNGDVKKFQTKSPRKPANLSVKFGDFALQTLEAKLGNLLLANNAKALVVSVPAVMQKSSYHPFGDGQSNARLGLGSSWKAGEFPVVGIQEIVDGKPVRKYSFHTSLNVTQFEEVSLNGNWYKVTPKVWDDSFYFNFETSTLSLNNFLNGIPEQYRTFSQGRVAPNLSKIAKTPGIEGFKNLGEGYNLEAWYAGNVHGLFPDVNGTKTVLGGVPPKQSLII